MASMDELTAAPAGATSISFEEFVAVRGHALLRTAYLLTRDHHLAEDLVQTSFAKAWGAWNRIDGEREAYVRRILVNTYSSWWRRKWNGEKPTAELPEPGADGSGAEPESRDALWDALGRLGKRQRATVVLRIYEDLSVSETARVLGCSEGTVKSQLAKALATLRIDPELLDTFKPGEQR